MARTRAPTRRLLWLSLVVSLVFHLLAVRLGLMPSITSLLGRAGETVQEATRTGMRVLRIASRETQVERPTLPPEIAPDAADADIPMEFELKPAGLQLEVGLESVPGDGTGPGVRPPVPLVVHWFEYPQDAIRDQISGVVRLRVLVGGDGRVRDVEVIESLRPDCDRAAVEAAERMIFEPAMEGGRRVSAWVEYEIPFDLGTP